MASGLALYLVDTNVWLERLLDQERSREVGDFLAQIASDRLHITDFALHSIGLILTRLSRPETFRSFVHDLFVEGSVILVRLAPGDMLALTRAIERFSLDFDDAYQYLAAEKHGLTLVSFDTDFDQTDLRRQTPAQVL
jgi:hypothetical protein